MPIKTVGFRLQTEGKADLVNDLSDARAAGAASVNGVADAAEQAGERIARATDRYTERQMESYRKQAAAAKIAAAAGAQRAEFDAAVAVPGSQQFSTVNLDRSTGAARTSAEVFTAAFEQEEAAARATALAEREAARSADEQAASVAKLRAAIDPLYTARLRYNDEVRSANSLLSQGAIAEEEHRAALARSADAYRQLADAAGVAADRQQVLWAEEASAARAAVAADGQQSRFAQIGATSTGKSARGSAEIFEADARAQDEATAAATKLRSAIDPLWAAEQRLAQELEEVNTAARAGILTDNQIATAQIQARKRYDETTDAMRRQHGAATGLSMMQRQTLIYTASDIVASSASGASPAMIAMQQGPQVLQAFAAEEGGMQKLRALLFGSKGIIEGVDAIGDHSQSMGRDVSAGTGQAVTALDGLKDTSSQAAASLGGEQGVAGATQKATGLLTPMRLVVGATALAVAIGAKAWLDYSDNIAKLNAVSMGSGRLIGMTGTQLEASAVAAAAAGDMSVNAAREIQVAFVEAGDISGDVLTDVTALTKDFAAATGQDAAGAARELGAAFADPIAGADALAGKFGVLSQAQVEHIGHLVEENDLTGAQKVLLDALGPAFAGAADQANVLARGWDNISAAASGAWSWMGKALDRMATGGALQDKIRDLQAQRDRGPSVGQMLLGTSTDEYRAGIDKQINDLRYQMRQESARTSRDQANAAQAKGQGLADSYTGAAQLGQYQKNIGTLRAALSTQMPPEQREQLTETLEAYTHAVDTFIPRAEKANQVAAIDAKIAATKSPAAKAALAAEKARLEMSGQVITAADAETRATSAGDRARSQSTKSGDKHAQSLARQAQSMEVSAAAALDVADAYLKSSAAGIVAEAQRKASTDATRRGIDVEAQARRQLALTVAEGVANAAKTVAGMRDETSAREVILAQVRDGTLSVSDMSAALSDEAALRPLLALRTIAQGDALAKLNGLIDKYREAMGKARSAEAGMAFEKAMQGSVEQVYELKGAIDDLTYTPLDRALNAANRAANVEADNIGLGKTGDIRRTDLVKQREREAETRYQGDRAKYVANALDDQRDSLALSQRELQLAGANDNYRQAELGKLKLALDIRRQFPDIAQADLEKLGAGAAAQDAVNAKLKVTAAAIDEVRGYGADFADTMLSEDTWSSWANAGKAATGMIKAEFIKLALLNPLKNMINGNSNLPTIGSAIGAFSKLFGGAAAATTPTTGTAGLLGGNATGTEHWSGGLTWVNENGPEIADLPNGTRVYPAAETRRMMGANDGGGSRGGDTHYHIAGGNLLTPEFWDMIHAGDARAAMQGAAGGASMSEAEGRRGAARKLGRGWR